ncbi:membrane fusion protein, multidrug efflux system [Filimonas lacunae]|uniref:Membrane fusion protein, multidrug efflux system n=1 Tax=Filimonas lacunae TaxID=477680 RepID=A0A173MQP4_9BACT|nr:efflux RND transporter periplasmic adaptor subunit [Filimonas lacunae]BAV09658.1 Co/Zn/Cd efflux system membrane fusion protein [Filimonas lacunae]SIS76709.1 membrane fusion protein, multidrug efflux system [Filimonas lacunae]
MSSKNIPAIIACACLAMACGKKKQPLKASANQVPVVDVIVARYSNVINTIEANGTIIANEYVELKPEVSGRLIYLNVPEGKHVEVGTVIARVNDADLQATLNKTKVQLELAQKTEERLRKLLDINGVNQADYDAALNTLNGYKADISYTQALIDKTVIRAPFSGTVGLRQVSPGAFVTSASVIATMQQLNQLKIDFTIPEQYGNLVHTGGTVNIETDGSKGVRRKATITAIEPQANAVTRNLKVRAVISAREDTNPGAFAKVYVGEGQSAKAILIPTNAIIPDDKNKQVVLVHDGKAVFTSIQTGLRQSTNVAVINGMKEGDTLVVTGVLFAQPNAAVKVRQVKQLSQLVDSSATATGGN